MCDNQCDFCNNSTPDQNMGSEEEAHYYWTLNEFQELLRIYGARKVFGDLTYRDHVPASIKVNTIVTPTFVDYLKTQGLVGAEKYNDFLKGKKS